jgi:hypothetical protein
MPLPAPLPFGLAGEPMKSTITRLFLLIFALSAPACRSLSPPTAVAEGEVLIEDLVLTADDFVPEWQEGIAGSEEGLVPGASESSFQSRPIEAPIPFNAVVPQWLADLPGSAQLEMEIRTSADGQTWSDWTHSHAYGDWTRPEDSDIVGEMVLVPPPDETHAWVQYRLHFADVAATPATVLRELTLTFIDSTDGPTTEQLVEQQQALDALTPEPEGIAGATEYPKPFVVSRSVWCQNADCVYSDGLEYYPVSHLIVHHTVSANSSSDWAAVVRAIWSFHTYTREWGDIGYNYLVDPNGVIYEGHYGGDDVVGTHASGANAGSMAVALLGTFTLPNDNPPGIKPPQPMQDAAVAILSWKADQRDINVFDAGSELPNISWGLPKLMGHRDVYGTTECPGDQAHLLIPSFRQRIAQNIGLVDPHLYVDELSPGFSKSQAAFFEPPYLCGWNNHSWYAWSTSDPGAAQNWGEWRPNIPADGRYRIYGYAPYCRTGRPETTSATYTITHADGTTNKTVNMNSNVGLWYDLGEYNLRAGTSNVVRLSNLTGDNEVGVWFDTIRLLPITTVPAPVVSNIEPAQDVWKTQRPVTFNWQIANAGSVTQTNLQIAADPSFGSLISSQSWPGAATSGGFTFAQDYRDVYWRVVLTWTSGSPVVGPVSHFRLDSTPPESSMAQPQLVFATGLYRLNWSGSDAIAGVKAYNVDFRVAGQNWVRLVSNSPYTTAGFYKPDPAQSYEFRVQAIDVAGNAEQLSETAEANTNQVFALPVHARVPLALR